MSVRVHLRFDRELPSPATGELKLRDEVGAASTAIGRSFGARVCHGGHVLPDEGPCDPRSAIWIAKQLRQDAGVYYLVAIAHYVDPSRSESHSPPLADERECSQIMQDAELVENARPYLELRL